jgi:hypothetical protein
MTEAKVPKEKAFLSCCDVLVHLIKDGELGGAVTLAGRAGTAQRIKINVWIASPWITRSFGKSNRKVGGWINGTH